MLGRYVSNSHPMGLLDYEPIRCAKLILPPSFTHVGKFFLKLYNLIQLRELYQ